MHFLVLCITDLVFMSLHQQKEVTERKTENSHLKSFQVPSNGKRSHVTDEFSGFEVQILQERVYTLCSSCCPFQGGA